ncbi:MAG: hypothetical protein J0L84_13370, partial [Verrucomicrobia bacterium]|nr:hypothetical protein [Verrucomicrobiota bacterium]
PAMNPPDASASPTPAGLPAGLRILGLGGAGGRLAHRLSRLEPGVPAWALDTDAAALQRLEGLPAELLGASVQRGLGCGGDAIQAANLAERDHARLQESVPASGFLLLLAGMGGGTGSGVAPVAARLARDRGVLVVALVAMPFDFEGRLRRTNAQQGLEALRSVADLVIPIPHQAVLCATSATSRADELLGCADGFLLGIATGLVRMLRGPFLIPLGIADLARVLRGRRGEGGAAAAEAEGPDRLTAVWTQLLQHPFLTARGLLANAAALVLQVSGGPDLTLEELESLERLAQAAAPQAQVILGAVTQGSLAGRLSVLMVVAPPEVSASSRPESAAAGAAGGTELGERRELVFEDSATPAETSGSVRIARTPLTEGRRGTHPGKSRPPHRSLQQQFDFTPRRPGRFEGVEPTLRGGENLDEPTYARRGVKFN